MRSVSSPTATTRRARRTSAGGSFARVSLPPVVTATNYDGANKLTDWNGATLAYDDNGNLTSDGTTSYTWIARNDLASTAGGSTTTASFYDEEIAHGLFIK